MTRINTIIPRTASPSPESRAQQSRPPVNAETSADAPSEVSGEPAASGNSVTDHAEALAIVMRAQSEASAIRDMTQQVQSMTSAIERSSEVMAMVMATTVANGRYQPELNAPNPAAAAAEPIRANLRTPDRPDPNTGG